MAEQFYTILTKVGKSKLANANALGTKLNLVKFQVGDSGGAYYNPTEDQSQLKNKVWEGPIDYIGIDTKNPNWMILRAALPGDVGGFTIRETGIVDSDGDLIAIGKHPETYKPLASEGSSKDISIKMVLEVSNASSIVFNVDPAIVLATKEDMEELGKLIDDTSNKIDTKTTEAKNYTDEQIALVTATGIPKLVTYEYDLYATIDNQAVFTIPYDYFNSATDTLMVEVSGIDVPKSYYTITNPVVNPDNSITKGYITLTQGRPLGSFLKMRILKNVPIGPDGAISGRVMAVNSIPQDRIENINKIVQTDADGDIPIHKGKSRPNLLPNSTFNFGMKKWKQVAGTHSFNMVGDLYGGDKYANGGYLNYSWSTSAGEFPQLESDPILIVGNIPLILSAEMYTLGLTSGEAYMEVNAFDINKNNLGAFIILTAINSKDMTKYYMTGVTPVNTAYVTVKCVIRESSTNTGVAWRRIKLEGSGTSANKTPSPYSQEADIILACDSTTRDITYYVDGTNGNDNNDGLSSGTGAFKTIGKAISVLPRNINHNVTISIANGTYNESLSIYGFMGPGSITMNCGASAISNLIIQCCNCAININNLSLTTYKSHSSYTDYCLLVINSRYVYTSYATITVTDTVKKQGSGAIVVTDNAAANISNCTLSNARSAIGCNLLSNIYSYNNAGSGNAYGLSAQNGGKIARSGTQPSGSTSTETTGGGQII